jgi:histone deacetylase complex regulatory component SIN3
MTEKTVSLQNLKAIFDQMEIHKYKQIFKLNQKLKKLNDIDQANKIEKKKLEDLLHDVKYAKLKSYVLENYAKWYVY